MARTLRILQYGKTLWRHDGNYGPHITERALINAKKHALRLVSEGKMETGDYEVTLWERGGTVEVDSVAQVT